MPFSLVAVLFLFPIQDVALNAAPKAPAAKKKGKKEVAPPHAPVGPEIFAALDQRQGAVGGCIVEGQEEGKAWKQVAKVKLTLTAAGQVMAVDVAFEPENEKTDAVKQCIETIIRGGEWPRSPNPLVIAEREWTFEMK